MNNFISLNIKYLCSKKNLNQDEFGLLFNLKKGVVGSYIRENAIPKLETITAICNEFKISIDDFINTDLSQKAFGIKENKILYASEPEREPYIISPRYVESLEKIIEDKERIIKALEESLKDKERLIQTLEGKKTTKTA